MKTIESRCRRWMIHAAFVVMSVSALAQGAGDGKPMSNQEYETQWKTVERMVRQEEFRKAHDMTMPLFERAEKEGNSRQMLTAAWLLGKIEAAYLDSSDYLFYNRMKHLMPLLDAPDKAVAQMLVGRFLLGSRNYWNQNENTDVDEEDYRLWSNERLKEEADKYIDEIVAAHEALGKVPSTDYRRFMQDTSSRTRRFTPTLLDVVVYTIIEDVDESSLDRNLQMLSLLRELHSNDGDEFKLFVDYKEYNLRARQMTVEAHLALVDEYLRQWRNSTLPDVAFFYLTKAHFHGAHKDYLEQDKCYDTIIERYPTSEFCNEARKEKEEIRWKNIVTAKMNHNQMTLRPMMASVQVRNIDTLYCRIVEQSSKVKTSANSTVLMGAKPLKEWSQPLPHRDDFQFQTVYLYLPPMPAGEYLLLISGNADFRPDKTELYDDNGAPFNPKDFAQFRMAEFICCDAAFLVFHNMLPSHYGGRLVNRATGEAIARHQVVLYNSSNKAYRKKIATTKTDAEGFFFFDTTSNENYYKNGVFSVIYQGIEYTAGVDTRYYAPDYSDDVLKVLFDRPIYRPGDTLHFAVMDYHKYDRLRGEAVSEELVVTVYDVNHKELTKLTLTTNERGAADGWVAIPSNVLPGRMQLHVIQKSKKHSFSEYFRVEAYKQPKFYATMEEDHEAHHYHQPIAVKGMARAYSGASMSGAQVTYTVTRRAFVPWWKRYWGYTVSDKTAEMAHGTTVCANDGSFGFEFVPLPDSSALNQFLTYYVDVTVTDLNGETQTTQTSFMMGPENIRLRAQIDGGAKLRQLKTVDYELTNLDGTPLDGRVRVVVDKLKVPADMGLEHYALCDNGIHTLPLDEYRKQFPLMDYTLTDRRPDNWMVERTVLLIESEATRNQKVTRVDMPPLMTGVYRITLSSVDDEGHKVEDQTTLFLTSDQADRLPAPDLLFLDVDKKRVKVGEEITLRIGSAYDVDVALLIEYGDSVAEPMVYHFSPKHQMQTITITTTEAMAGTIGVNAFALLENVSEDESVEIEVTVPERTLDVTLTTFRDRLQPSVDETWTLKVSGAERYKGGRAPLAGPAQVVLSMYDAALDNYYGTLSWSLPYWRGPGSYVSFSYNNDGSYFYSRWGRGYSFKPNTKDYTPTIFDLSGWRLADIDRGYRSRYVSRNRLKGATLQTIQVIEEKGAPAMAEEEEEAVFSIVAGVAGVGENEEVVNEEVVNQIELMYDKGFVAVTEAGGGEPKVNVRTNLNTLAFFRPDLVTDAEGNVSFTFCAPELLTQWNIKGAAWTKDMAVGSLIAQCVTQKELMVVPNAPRYLRQGDVVDFVVKVSNLTDEAQLANVSLTLTDAATGKDIVVDKSLRMVSIDAKSSMAVPFRIVVPDNVAVVTYKVVAYNQYHSDGEQANIIVLPNRQLVTESMAMYVNGRQTKQYALPHLLASDSSNTLQHQMMAVELTSNPIWYAIQTLPYVSECENPSNIYRFHAYYVNSLGSYIAHLSPNIQKVFDQWAQDTTGAAFLSNLQKNEDIKQTLLEETPWLRDGNSENERHRQVAAFFDKEQLSAQLNDNQKKLLESQQRNGGWMWIDGAKETSPYVTQYILKGLGHLSALTQEPLSKEWNRPVEKALDYVDQEEYKYYVKYIKNEKWLSGATDIDYLYTRSFYPDRRFAGKTREAYDFYYNNLRKNYTQFKGLYTRAEVALILHRHGDKKQARELLHRIVQSSQTSDAMGMYWRDNVSGYFWNERPIEVQALIIEAFAEIMPEDTVSVALMQQWLLKQKQTTRWNSDIATIHAVNALMTGSGRQQLQQTEPALTIALGGNPVDMGKAEAGTGYQSRRFQADEVKSDMGDITISKSTDGIAWGAVYWQYFEQLDKIPYSEMGVKMERKLYRVDRDDQLTLVTPSTELKVGDRLRVRILIDCDRNLEYLELRDGRASTFEPVSTRSGWRWNGGLSYYMAVRNASTSLYIDRLDKGKYVAEYDVWVTNSGRFMVAPVTIQCLYAPEFRSTVGGVTIEVKE